MTIHRTKQYMSPLERLATFSRGGFAGSPADSSQCPGTEAVAWILFSPATRTDA
jgi:hypothetical protein